MYSIVRRCLTKCINLKLLTVAWRDELLSSDMTANLGIEKITSQGSQNPSQKKKKIFYWE